MLISDLPKEYRKLAEKNRNASGAKSNTVSGAFYWRDTDEGYDFWVKVMEAKTTEELPSIK